MGKVFDALEKHKRGASIRQQASPFSNSPETMNRLPDPSLSSKLGAETGFSPKVLVTSAPNSVESETFKLLRARILFPKNGTRPRTIMVTSTFPGEGKTFVAANLAASMAMGINERVLGVDCDFRRPNLHKMLGCSNSEGLYEYLTGKRSLSELLVTTGLDKLSLLTAGKPGPEGTELLSSSKMKTFLEDVKRRFEDTYIIVDSAPSHVTAEVGVLSTYVDGIVFVVMTQKAPRNTIQRSIDNLGRQKILGIVFNGYRESHKDYYKYYRKYYGRQ